MSSFSISPSFGGYTPKNLYRKALPDAEADGVLKKLGSVGTSALQTGLYALDTPGAAVRGGLGKLIGAKASDGDRVSGRDLTNAAGLTDRYDKGWGSWAAGLGAEMITDPLSYLTLGTGSALTGAGKAAAKAGGTKGLTRLQMLRGFDASETALRAAGHGDDAIRSMRNGGQAIASPEVEKAISDASGKAFQPKESLGGLFGVGLPFQGPSAVFGTGQTAQKVAGALDKGGRALKYNTLLGRWGTSLLDNRANGAVGGAVQRAAVEAGHPAFEGAAREGRDYLSGIIGHLDPAIKAGANADALLRETRSAAEIVRARPSDPFPSAPAQAAGDLMRRTERGQADFLQENGVNLKRLNDQFANYAPRAGLDIQAAKDIAAGKAPISRGLTNPQMTTVNNLPLAAGENFHRSKVYRDVPGGTNQVNDFVNQYAGTKVSREAVAQDLFQQMLKTGLANGRQFDLNATVALSQKGHALAGRLRKLDPDYATHGTGIFHNNEAANAARSGDSYAQQVRGLETIYRVIRNEGAHVGDLASDAVPIHRVLQDVGLTRNRLGDASTGIQATGARIRALEELAGAGAPSASAFHYAPGGALKAELRNYALPRQIYNDLIASHGNWVQPEELKGPLKAGKDLTTTFKNMVYPLFPASNVRNAVSGLINNFATGGTFSNHALAFKLGRDTATADQLRRVLPEIPAGASDEQARDIARRSAFVDGKVGGGHSGSMDLDNNIAARIVGGAPGRTIPEPFGSNKTGGGNFAGDTGKLLGGGLFDQLKSIAGNFQSPFGPSGLRSPVKNPFRGEGPLAMEGVWGHGNKDFPALQAGRKVGTNIEDFLRTAKYLDERGKGVTGSVAGDAVRDLHFDYDDLTKFERHFMRQAFPFYTYMRKNLPLQAGWMASNPALPMTQLRTMEALRDQSGGYTPKYLASGAAVPIAGGRNGNQRYISGFGTPLEEAMERIRFKDGVPDLAGTLQQYLASGNPFIKAPLEQVFDKQLSTGRALSSLKAQGISKSIGGLWGDDNPQLLSQVLANSPAARFLSSFDKATDERKPIWARALNLGTGVKLTDVDLERQKAIEAANVRNELLSSMPHISQHVAFTPKRGEEANLTPQEIELLRLIPTMKERAISAAEKRKQLGLGL